MNRIEVKFAELKRAKKSAFVPFITAGDPDMGTSLELLRKLPAAGADVIELGIPFSDPMADGPINQASYLRALAAGATLPKVIGLVRKFRENDKKTPIVLMGAYNPIHAYGTARFAKDASEAGIDGLLIVDLPVEEDEVLRVPAEEHGIDIIRFLAPTTHDERLKVVLTGVRGYLYYASIAGITGTKSFVEGSVRSALARVRRASALPCVVGFGIRSPEEAGQIASIADGVVVGSAIVSRVAHATEKALPRGRLVSDVLEFCASLAKSVHAASRADVVG
jgi:tryptophan synthase alpha chain